MKDLIEALQIFLKYRNEEWPTHCEHYILCIMGVTKDEVSEEDQKRLDELGFTYLDDACGEPGWASFKFGSA
jgi:hypothetical protein